MQMYIDSTLNTHTQSCHHIFKTLIIILNVQRNTIIQKHTNLYT